MCSVLNRMSNGGELLRGDRRGAALRGRRLKKGSSCTFSRTRTCKLRCCSALTSATCNRTPLIIRLNIDIGVLSEWELHRRMFTVGQDGFVLGCRIVSGGYRPSASSTFGDIIKVICFYLLIKRASWFRTLEGSNNYWIIFHCPLKNLTSLLLRTGANGFAEMSTNLHTQLA